MSKQNQEFDQDEYYDSKYGLDSNYENADRNIMSNKIKKNSLNSKIQNKRSIGGSWSFREDYINSVKCKNFPQWNNNAGMLPKLKGDKLSKMKTNDTETNSSSPKTMKNVSFILLKFELASNNWSFQSELYKDEPLS